MKFAINYVNNDFNTKYTFNEDIYLKYPGFNLSIDEFRNIPNLKNKILLHGIIPSSGSIFDEDLCDNMDEWVKIFKKNNNKWVSLHFYYEDRFCPIEKVQDVCENNIEKIRKKIPDIPIIVENVPYSYKNQEWCLDPNVITYYCNKYDLGLLLDISHLVVYTQNKGIDMNEYLQKLPLDKICEIHISGYYARGKRDLLDAHFECFDKIYKLYENILMRTSNVTVTSLEYPVYNNYSEVINYLENITDEEIYNLQIKQLNRLKEIYERTIK